MQLSSAAMFFLTSKIYGAMPRFSRQGVNTTHVSPPPCICQPQESREHGAQNTLNHGTPWNTLNLTNLAHQDDNTGFVQVSETKIQGYSKSFKTLSEIFQGCTVASHVASLYDTKVSKMYKQQSCSAVHCYLCLNYLIMNYQRIKLCCTLRM